MRIIETYKKYTFLRYVIIGAVSFLYFLWMVKAPTFIDPDSFYHLKMAELMKEGGAVFEFPWLPFTVLKNVFIDHHFLYHVALIPFLFILPPFVAAKFATIIFAVITVLVFFHLVRRLTLPYPELVTILLLANSPFVFRLLLTKASALAIALLLLGVLFMLEKRWIALFITGILYSLTHGGFLLLLVIALLYVFSYTIREFFYGESAFSKFLHRFPFHILKVKKFIRIFSSSNNIMILLVTALSLITGILLSIYFPTNIKFLWQQVVEIGIFTKTNLRIGEEWMPYGARSFFMENTILLLMYTLSVVMYGLYHAKQNTRSTFFFIVSTALLLLTVRSKRFIEYSAPFTLLFSVSTLYQVKAIFLDIKSDMKAIPEYIKRAFSFLAILLVLLGIIVTISMSLKINEVYSRGFLYTYFKGVSGWLEQHTESNEIIYNADWVDFPALWYYNDTNYYISGLDPTFMYNENAELYDLYEGFYQGENIAQSASMLQDQFNVRYAVIRTNKGQLIKELLISPDFSKVYEDRDATIFQIN